MTMNHEDRAGPVVDRVNAAIRDNPLAAGLIGAGIAWMLLGGAKGFGAMAGIVGGAAGKAGAAASKAGNSIATGLAKAGSTAGAGLKTAASDVAGSVTSIVPDLSIPDLSDARAAMAERFDSAAIAGREYGAAIQSKLSGALERQPLLLGAIGLAIGAGIASTFATTAVEQELMGEQGSAMRERLQDVADDVKDRAKQVVADVKDKAIQQGLTADAVKSAAGGIGEKLKTVAGAGRDSVAQRFAEN